MEHEDLIRSIEEHVFKRLAKALTDYYEKHEEHVYFDLDHEDLGLDKLFFWKYGFEIRKASPFENFMQIQGIITGDLAKPFRNHLQSMEVHFEGSANWWSGDKSQEQELRDADVEALHIPVLDKLDDNTLSQIKAELDSFIVEKLTLGESDPFANTFDEMFTKERD